MISPVPFAFGNCGDHFVNSIFGADSIGKQIKIMMPLFFLLFVFMASEFYYCRMLLNSDINSFLLLIGSNLPIQWYGCGQWDKPSSPFPLQEAEWYRLWSLLVGWRRCYWRSQRYRILYDSRHMAPLLWFRLFCLWVDPAGGPGLLFVTLPTILQDMPGGQLFAIALYLVQLFLGEFLLFKICWKLFWNRFVIDFKVKRNYVLAILFLICMGIGLFNGTDYQMGTLDGYCIHLYYSDRSNDWAISWFWIMKKEDLLEEINKGRKNPVSEFGIDR